MSEPLSAAKQNLLLNIVDDQERMLTIITDVFNGLRQSSDPEVVLISGTCVSAIETHKLVAIAMTEALTATKH